MLVFVIRFERTARDLVALKEKTMNKQFINVFMPTVGKDFSFVIVFHTLSFGCSENNISHKTVLFFTL